MELIEVRDLDGPNVFLLEPTIKLELRVTEGDVNPERISALTGQLETLGVVLEELGSGCEALGEALVEATLGVHRRTGAAEPEVHWTELETPGHIAVVFSWSRRDFAIGVARLIGALALGQDVDLEPQLAGLAESLRRTPDPEDLPEVVRDQDRSIPIIGVTGTNGKTTTTRLIAAILRSSGRKVGWSSSSGVYIEGSQVMHGDYTGPSGARRVLDEPGLDVAVLETARGGILLRGIAYESNDVGVFINVSGDHLGLQGIHTSEGLANVKATVVRVTRADGFAVLNADDSLVVGFSGRLRASPFLVSRFADNPVVASHVLASGHALFVRDDMIVYAHPGGEETLTGVDGIPMTFGGRANHMVENALCAAAACLSLGLSVEDVRTGLAAFRNSPWQNTGRLNVYESNGATVIVDYAHNVAGLTQLLKFGRSFVGDGGRLISIVGTAGDRNDDTLRELGRIAAKGSDHVIVKDTARFLRGRQRGEMYQFMVEGINDGGGRSWQLEAGELDAYETAMGMLQTGDVVVIMCVEEYEAILGKLDQIGTVIS